MGSSTKRTEQGVGAASAASTPSRAGAKRALPIRSSPVSTAPSLRAKLSTLEASVKRTAAPARTKPKQPPFARNSVLQELEPRLLMSADLNPLSGDALLSSPALAGAEFRNIADHGTPTVVTSAAVAPIQRTNELVFVDTATPDYQKLIDEMRQSALPQGRNLEFVLIDADTDGIRKITDTLAKKSGLDAIHVISHASDGSVQLGSSQLDFESLVKRATSVRKWGSALTEDGDILFYGCDLAASEKGKSLLEAMSRLTRADVAASEDLTGSAAQGGDWDLEFRTGSIEAAVAVDEADGASYDGILAAAAQGGETRANTTTTGTQQTNLDVQARTVAIDGNGNFVVVWAGEGPGDTTGIFAQRYDANGVAQGSEFRVNTTTGSTQRSPAVAMDAAGNFIVAWTSAGQDGSGEGVYAQRYNAAGVAQGGEFRVNSFTAGQQRNPLIGMNESGTFVIAWDSTGQDGSGEGVYAQRYNAAGVAQGGEFRVNTTTAGDQWADSAAMDANGNFIVAFSSSDGNALGTFTRRYDAAGTALTGEVQVNTTTVGDQTWGSVAMNGSGEYVIAWMDTGADGSGRGVYAQRYNASGVAQGAEFRVNTSTAGDQEQPTIAIDGAGNFVVTWSSNGTDGSGWGVYRQDYNADGTLFGGEARVNTTTSGNQQRIGVAMNAMGQYVATWDGNGPGDTAGVFFQRYISGLVVDTVSDAIDGTTTSISALLTARGADGRISLREAITAANNTANVGGPDRIHFNIPGAGVRTINIAAELPYLTDAVIIDGTTQAGFAGTPLIELNGSVAEGLYLDTGSGGSTIRGLVMNGFQWAIDIVGSSNNLVAGNFLGTNAAGTAADANWTGVWIGTSNNTVGGTTAADRNIISGNSVDGVQISGTTGGSGNVVIGNYIGLDVTGTVDLGNTSQGVAIYNGGDNNTIGGTAAGAGNVISGNNGEGVRIIGAGTTGNVVLGNRIGTNAAGTAAVANGTDGVSIQGGASANTIGGTAAGALNLISGNSRYGVLMTGASTTGNIVLGNYIGTDVGGTLDLGNSAEGVRIDAGAATNTVGGTAAGAGNVISGNNGDGIEIQGAGANGNLVAGNMIGLNAAGTAALANTFNGILIALDADNNVIGGTAAGARNVISGNTTSGVHINGAGTSGNLVLGNYIGTDVTGLLDRGNNGDGVRISNGATGSTIGGSAAGAGNVISGNNTEGVRITDATTGNNVVQGNLIGRNATNTAALGNTNDGVNIQNDSDNNTIGGTNAGEGNVISANENGVQITGAATGNRILGNSIYGNTSTGIELNNDGVNPPNGTTNGAAPNIDMDTVGSLSAALGGTTLVLSGYVGNMPSSATFAGARVEFFVSDNDPTGWGEGRTYLGFLTANGSSQFNGTLNVGALVNVGDRITATATDAAGNTSEFSLNVIVAAARSISGTVYNDVNADAAVSGAEGVFSGATVRLYLDDGDGSIDAGDTFVAATTTDGTGAYSFSGLNTSRYWVVVDSKTLTLSAAGFNNFASGADDVWADQTYAVFGARTGLAGVTGVSGALYGGRYANVSDDGSLLNGEHVIGRDLSAASAANVDYGFSFDAIVNDRGDTTDDDGVGGTDRLQQGTLRQFILNANALAGVQTSDFSVGSGAISIALGAALPTITDAVVLDATTQEGFAATPLVELDGSGAGGGADGFVLAASNSTIRGFVINRFSASGIWSNGSNNVIAGNYIGLDLTGAIDLGNGSDGVVFVGGGADNTVGGTNAAHRNVISGNTDDGVSLDGSLRALVIGNYIGTNAAGNAVIGNGGDGVAIQFGATDSTVGGTTPGERNVISGNGASGNPGVGVANIRVRELGTANNVISGNYIGTDASGTVALVNPGIGIVIQAAAAGTTIGGTAAGAGNVISGSSTSGVEVAGSSANLIQGNFIGTNAAGAAALGNGTFGVHIVDGSNNTIGGTAAGARNVISGNLGDDGIEILQTVGVATGNVVQGNYIGLDASGTNALGNAHTGVAIVNSDGNTIGGVVPAARNVISANGHNGIYLAGANNVVQGNYIGTDATGTVARGNSLRGIQVLGDDNTIGGQLEVDPTAGNLIANNSLAGITVAGGADGNRLLGNRIVANGGLGIDLAGDGLTPNDAGDGDAGANNLQNYPVLTSANVSGANVAIAGSLDSALGGSFRLEFFASSAADPSGHGEAERYLGFLNVTDGGMNDLDGLANGTIAFSTTLAPAIAVVNGEAVSATATALATGNTSEFSANHVANSAPVNSVPASVTATEDLSFAFTGANTISVADGQGNLTQVVLAVANGTLTAAGPGTVVGSGTPSITITGTQASINASLATLAYQGNPNYSGPDTLSVVSTNSGGMTDSDSVAITVNPVNDAPSASAPASYNATEQTLLNLAGTLSVGDVDAAAGMVTVTVSVVSGQINAGAGATGAIVSGSTSGTVTITGTLTQVANVLAGNAGSTIGYFNASDTPPATDTLTLSINDGGNTGAGGALVASANSVINIAAVNDGPSATAPAAYAATEQVSLSLASALLTVFDVDAGGAAVSITLSVISGTLSATAGTTGVGIVGSGSAALTLTGSVAQINNLLTGGGGSTLTYLINSDTPPATDTLTVSINDGGNSGSGGALNAAANSTINITALNDAPVNTVPVSITVTEDVASALTGISIADVDAGAGNVLVTLSVPSGTLGAITGGGVTVGGSGTGTLTLSGTVGSINAFIAASNVSFTTALNQTAAVTLTVTTNDQGNSPPPAQTDADSVTLNVTPVNAAPVNTVPVSISVTEDVASALTGISIADADAGAGNVLATLSVPSGTLAATTGGGVTVGGSGTGTLTLSGTVGSINAFIAASNLTFTTALNQTAAVTLTVTTDDQGNTPGPALNDSDTVTLNVTAVNDAPVNTVPVSITVTEDVASALTGILIADVDAGAGNVLVTLSVPSGTLAAVSGGGVTVGGSGSGTLTLSGTVANINAFIAASSVAFTTALNQTAPVILTVTTNDQGNSPAPALNDSETVTLNVSAANDAPAAAAPAAYAATEQTLLNLAGAGMTVGDADSLGANETVTISVLSGVLNATAGATGVAIGGAGTNTLTLVGTIAQLNNLLAGNFGATLDYFNASDTPPSTDALTLSIDDGGNTGAGGVLNASVNSIINIAAVNDAPVNAVPAPQIANEDTPLTFSVAGGNAIAVADADAATLEVTLTATNGVLTLASLAGLTFSAGDGAADTAMTFSGTVAAINFALDGLSFVPDADYSGAASFSILADDLGQTGAGGALQDADVVNIALNPVNDVPVMGARSFAVIDGQTVTIGTADLSASDVDDAATSLVFDVGSVANGHFELLSAPGVALASFTQQQVMNGEVRFVHDGSNVAPAVTVTVRDAAAGAGPYALTIAFTPSAAPGIAQSAAGGGGGGGAPVVVAPPPLPPVTKTETAAAGERIGDTYLRAPTSPPSDGGDDGGPVEVAAPVLAAAPGASQVQKVLAAETIQPVGRAEGESVDTKPLSSEIEVVPVRPEMQVLPLRRESFDSANDEERQTIEAVMSSVRVTGLAFSVGAVWWAARAAGLVASLLASSPAWRHVDPLPVLGRDDEEEREWDESAEEDKDHKDDEHRAAWVLEERG